MMSGCDFVSVIICTLTPSFAAAVEQDKRQAVVYHTQVHQVAVLLPLTSFLHAVT
jgi:hypothetical protein